MAINANCEGERDYIKQEDVTKPVVFFCLCAPAMPGKYGPLLRTEIILSYVHGLAEVLTQHACGLLTIWAL